jgi:hypothetical protein
MCNAASVLLFYHVHGVWVPLSWGLMNFTIAIVTVLFAALGSELFPTSYRSTASGVRSVVATLGAVAGLWAEGRLYVLTTTHAAAITSLLLVTPIAPLIVTTCLPETASRELEEISPERIGRRGAAAAPRGFTERGRTEQCGDGAARSAQQHHGADDRHHRQE